MEEVLINMDELVSVVGQFMHMVGVCLSAVSHHLHMVESVHCSRPLANYG